MEQKSATANRNQSGEIRPYVMRISRLTIDKLGVKLYDAASAVVAELIANSYDADSEEILVRLPLSTLLARRTGDGLVEDVGYVIEVEDNGHGMTRDEVIDYYLEVGRDRRQHPEQGKRSRTKDRPVMGRKGIGKLAPFGICRTIEVISAGGEPTADGYGVSHFAMNFDDVVKDTDEAVPLNPGEEDQTFRPRCGTTVRLSRFLPKRVPDPETFHRQLARRFALAKPDFSIMVEDLRNPEENPPAELSPLSVPVMEGTRIDLARRSVPTEDGEQLPVKGWLALARDAYKNEETAGVRLYARGKIVGWTRDFEQPAGYTGEFTTRSYLVGEVHAEWIDTDDGDDLIRTDRQNILWESDYGRALRTWGATLIREIGAASRGPRRRRVSQIFLEKSHIEERAAERFGADSTVVEVAVDLAKQIGSFAAEDELEDPVYVSDLTDIILSVAPHRALIEAFQEFASATGVGDVSFEQLSDLFGKARVAEMASYSQIAAERVRAIRELERLVMQQPDEAKFQQLLADAPWLIEATWSVITRNQSLKTFKAGFEDFYKRRTGDDVVLAIGYERKRPDFTLVSVGHMLHIVEIKSSGHTFDDNDFDRLLNYVDAFDEFFEKNQSVQIEFHNGYRIDVIADGERLAVSANRHTLAKFKEENKVVRRTWHDFLVRAKVAHELFLNVEEAARDRVGEPAS